MSTQLGKRGRIGRVKERNIKREEGDEEKGR